MKVWLTENVISSGIREVEAEMCVNTNGETVRELDDTGYYPNILHYKPNWHGTRQEAVEYSNSLIERRVKSLRKQLTKLESFQFI